MEKDRDDILSDIQLKAREQILDFIHRRFPEDSHWTDGNCYWFAVILRMRFPESTICYMTHRGHFIVSKNNEYYDHTGVVDVSDDTVMTLAEIYKLDKEWYYRLMRDCAE